MYVVIFRARIRALDEEYLHTAARLRELALGEFGCTAFHSLTGGDEEIALSYWPDEASIVAWKQHPEHLAAQAAGRAKWYASYTVEVAQIGRRYSSADARGGT